jgi:predicted alpha/beta hydrolase family esterase
MRTVDTRRNLTELRTLIVPGLQGSGPMHWQSVWQCEHPEYERVVQEDWGVADLDRWADAIVAKVEEHSGSVVLVAHSYGCLAAVRAAPRLAGRVAGALLAAPADPARFGADGALRGIALGARWIVVASRNDPWMPFERARNWAAAWSSRFVDAGHAGHVNADAGFGEWPAGERLLGQLRHEALYADPAALTSVALVGLAA